MYVVFSGAIICFHIVSDSAALILRLAFLHYTLEILRVYPILLCR